MLNLADLPNCRVDLDDRAVTACVWDNHELAKPEAARWIARTEAHLCKLASDGIPALVLDLSAASLTSDSRTRRAFSSVLEAWGSAHRPVAVVKPAREMDAIHLERLLLAAASSQTRLVDTLEDANAWIELAVALSVLPATAPMAIGA